MYFLAALFFTLIEIFKNKSKYFIVSYFVCPLNRQNTFQKTFISNQIENCVESIIGCHVFTCENILLKKICSFGVSIKIMYVMNIFDGYFKFKSFSINTRNDEKKSYYSKNYIKAARASFRGFWGVKLFNSFSSRLRRKMVLMFLKNDFRTLCFLLLILFV